MALINRYYTIILFLCAVSVFGFMTGTRASAQVTFLFNKGEYIANHPHQTIQTFAAGNVSPGSFTFCLSPVDQFSNDKCFVPGDILPGLVFTDDPVGSELFLAGVHLNGAPNPRKALSVGGDLTDLDITFPDGGVHSAGIVLGCFVEGPGCSTTLAIRLFGAGDAPLGNTQVLVSDRFDSFIGFDSPVTVTRIEIAGPDSGNTVEAIDEVRFEGVSRDIPTLSEWGMISAAAGLGLIGVFFAVKRRRLQAGA